MKQQLTIVTGKSLKIINTGCIRLRRRFLLKAIPLLSVSYPAFLLKYILALHF